uniref:HPS6 biosis of lysosomal organelles complex 2 subunit 3 n=1 Tax=Latimeria chalumnae TaxID=7897 RepID=H2ZYY4_LATCH
MKEFVLEKLSDFSDFARHKSLVEILRRWQAGSGVLASPDGRHLLLLTGGSQEMKEQQLSTFDRIWSCSPPAPLQESRRGAAPAPATAVGIVLENGRTEFWRYAPCQARWELAQTANLCNSPRARVVSVCSQGQLIVWCEERPPSESSLTPAKSAFSYCICKRTFELREPGVELGSVQIVLHNSPSYQVLSAADGVFLWPSDASLGSVSKCLLIWTPWDDRVTITAPAKGYVKTKNLNPLESDFKRFVLDCVGFLSSVEPCDAHHVGVSHCGGLLLVDRSNAIILIQSDGTKRHIYSFPDGSFGPDSKMVVQIAGTTLVCVLGRILYLVNVSTGKLMEKMVLTTDVLTLLKPHNRNAIQILTKTGIYTAKPSASISGLGHEVCNSEAVLGEMVFEEACKYYQRRSLNSTRLTVEKLKKGGMFQAPIALSSILQHYLARRRASSLQQEAYMKLLHVMDTDLQSYSSLEQLKASVIQASEKEISRYCHDLVEQEITRLFHSELDRENLVYLNSVFSIFPRETWKAIKRTLQLQQNGEGFVSARATPDVWKTVLHQGTVSYQDTTMNGAIPVFELICHSLYRFKPKWLPRFVELTQQHVSGTWNYGGKENPENVPLYKRAMSVLQAKDVAANADDTTELEIELLLCSERPKAILQAIRTLIFHKKWERVVAAAQQYSQKSPLLNKEIFTILLEEFSQHRNLDPYLKQLWALCPEDITVTDILNVVLKHVPKSEQDTGPYSKDGSLLTVGLLKPLLSKVLQRECRANEEYSCVLQAPTFPPPTPPRNHRTIPRSVTDPCLLTVSQQA